MNAMPVKISRKRQSRLIEVVKDGEVVKVLPTPHIAGHTLMALADVKKVWGKKPFEAIRGMMQSGKLHKRHVNGVIKTDNGKTPVFFSLEEFESLNPSL